MSPSFKNETRRWIKPLPKQLINKIAAGEVVERPASVVKELVENAIDAGADRIDIIIEKSGTKLIKIIDNGCGIDEEQLEIAFSRHATSKISNFSDLDTLYTYGFRGEALPSIASVSRVRMVSRTPDAESGTEIIYEGGVLQSKKPIAVPVGTAIEVEDLFYNTPARRKFLKAESTESRHISRFTTALAIGRPDIGISFSLNGRKIFAQQPEESLRERVSQILGGTNRKFIAVEGESEVVKISGHIGTPETVQHNRFGQFIFINNRYIASSTLSHAFNAGYEEMLPRGQYPVGALLLTVDTAEVDVNVHPAKTEVRLSHEREIHDAIYRTIRDTLRQDGIIPSLDSTHRGAAAPFRKKPESFGPDAFGVTKSNYIPGLDARPKGDYKFISEIFKGVKGEQVRGQSEEIVKVDKHTGEIIEDKTQPESTTEKPVVTGPSGGFRFIGCFSELYLLIQAGDDLYVVDQHTAHERVLYEEILPGIENQSINSQQLLFPVQVELTPEQLAVFDESCEFINRSGFQASPFGGRVVNIEAVPTVLSKKSPEMLFLKIIDDLASLRKSGHDLKKAIAQSIACRSAVMAGDRLSNEEAIYLLETLLNCENGYCCPHGRPTFIKINRNDLDRQFGRI